MSRIAAIENSFKKAMRGEEDLTVLIWWWGILGYLVAYFIVNKAIVLIDSAFVDALLAIVGVIYFIWHIYVLRKCSPKAPKLSKEEKQRLRAERRKEFVRSFFRKLFLQEPITKFSPAFTATLVDLFAIANFGLYIF